MYAGQYYDAGSKYEEYVMLGCQSFQLDYAVCEKEKMKFASLLWSQDSFDCLNGSAFFQVQKQEIVDIKHPYN